MRYSHHIDGTLTESVLDQWTASYFYSSAGATQIETEEKLQFALDAMFYYRGKLGLEEQVIYDDISYAFGKLKGCSKKTKRRALELQVAISKGAQLNYEAQEWFLKKVASWLDHEKYPWLV